MLRNSFLARVLIIYSLSPIILAGNVSVTKCVGPDGHIYFTDTGCQEVKDAKVEIYTIQNATLSPIEQAESLKKQARSIYKDAKILENRGGLRTEVRERERQAQSLEREADVLLGMRQSTTLTQEEIHNHAREDQQDSTQDIVRKQEELIMNNANAQNRAEAAESRAQQAEQAVRHAENQARKDRIFEKLGVPR